MINFTKMNGAGNDFVITDNRITKTNFTPKTPLNTVKTQEKMQIVTTIYTYSSCAHGGQQADWVGIEPSRPQPLRINHSTLPSLLQPG